MFKNSSVTGVLHAPASVGWTERQTRQQWETHLECELCSCVNTVSFRADSELTLLQLPRPGTEGLVYIYI